jgi:hypothetical protein
MARLQPGLELLELMPIALPSYLAVWYNSRRQFLNIEQNLISFSARSSVG